MDAKLKKTRKNHTNHWKRKENIVFLTTVHIIWNITVCRSWTSISYTKIQTYRMSNSHWSSFISGFGFEVVRNRAENILLDQVGKQVNRIIQIYHLCQLTIAISMEINAPSIPFSIALKSHHSPLSPNHNTQTLDSLAFGGITSRFPKKNTKNNNILWEDCERGRWNIPIIIEKDA